MYSERTGLTLTLEEYEELRKEHECLEKEHAELQEKIRSLFAGVFPPGRRNLGLYSRHCRIWNGNWLT